MKSRTRIERRGTWRACSDRAKNKRLHSAETRVAADQNRIRIERGGMWRRCSDRVNNKGPHPAEMRVAADQNRKLTSWPWTDGKGRYTCFWSEILLGYSLNDSQQTWYKTFRGIPNCERFPRRSVAAVARTNAHSEAIASITKLSKRSYSSNLSSKFWCCWQLLKYYRLTATYYTATISCFADFVNSRTVADTRLHSYKCGLKQN